MRRTTEDFAAELDAHLQMEVDRLVAEGMSLADARAAARKAFGNPTRAREQFYERSRWLWIDQFAQDVRYAARGLRRSPAFLTATVLTLAVGLNLLTVAFTVFNAYVFRPFAVDGADRLVEVGWSGPRVGSQILSREDFEALRLRDDVFDGVIAEDTRLLSSDGRTLAASHVSDDYFRTLNPPVLLGRGLGTADNGQAAGVLGYPAWQRLFGGDPAAIGRELNVEDRRVTVVGVMRPEFGGLDGYPKDLWLPMPARAVDAPLRVIARLRRDVTRAQAAAALSPFAARKAAAGEDARTYRAVLEPNRTAVPMARLAIVLSPVFGAFALVLLTACANASSAMLARAIARKREIGVRLALGASRSRIVRQLLTEGLLITILAGAAAVAGAAWAVRGGIALLFQSAPAILASLMRVPPMSVDLRVLLFASAVAAAATFGFALIPALRTSRQPLTDAFCAQRTWTGGGTTIRSVLVTAQVAVSMLLVVVALVAARNFSNLARLDVGYQTAGVYSITIRAERGGEIPRVVSALEADPRVEAVAVTSGNPLFVRGRTVTAGPARSRAVAPIRYSYVAPEYFSLLRLPLTRGRGFRADEAQADVPVAIVSESTARLFWPGADPIGRTVRLGRAEDGDAEGLDGITEVTVIGTAADVVSGLIVDGRDPSHIYLPATPSHRRASAILLRSRAASGFRSDLLRPIFRRLGYETERFETFSLDEMRVIQAYPFRAAAWVGGLLAAIALALSVTGLYAVLSYALAQRAREIGIRMALGATASAVVSLVMRQSARMTAAGVLLGLAVSLLALRLVEAAVEFRQLRLIDPLALTVAVFIVAAATALAAYRPARRAARIDPAETLRAEA